MREITLNICWINRMKQPFLFMLYTFLSLCTFAQGQTELGSIKGLVSDKVTEEPLAGVNVIVEGTYLGASTDVDGFFTISNVEPGVYSLEVSYVSFKIIKQTGVRIEPGESKVLNFKMETSILALGQEIVVVGKKPLLDIDETSTIRSMGADDIENRIVENLEDIVSQQVGITKQDDEIHIRGGRSYEVNYMVDGISVQDPLAGGGFGLKMSSKAIKTVDVITGGSDAQYGATTSGTVNVNMKSGDDDYNGLLSYKMDHLFGTSRSSDFSFNTDNYDFDLSGPEPITSTLLPAMGLDLPGKVFFLINLHSLIADDYSGSTAQQINAYTAPEFNGLLNAKSLAPRQNNRWSAAFKLNWNFTPTHKLSYSYNRSILINQNTKSLQTNLEYVEPQPGFPYEFSTILDNYNTFTHSNELILLKWSHTLNATSFYDLRFSRYFANMRSEWQPDGWSQYTIPIDVPRLPVEYYTNQSDSTKVRVIPGDGLYDYGNTTNWHDHYIQFYTLKADITSIVGNGHSIKAGIEANIKEMQLLHISYPFAGEYGSSQDMFRVHPFDGAIYAQDDVRFGGFILNAGLRLDYMAPGKYADDAINDTTNFIGQSQRDDYIDDSYNVFGRRVKFRLLPRVGVSFPISNNQMLYFNYGHHAKQPRPQFLYSGLSKTSELSSFQTYGNPALNPETSVMYELGVRHKFSENDVITFTAYYKDIFDYVKTTRFTIPGRGGQTGYTYINSDYARSRGIEAEYKTRIGRYLFGNISGSYSITTTKASNAAAILQIDKANTGDDEPIKESYAVWDRPWQVSSNLTVRVPKNDNFSLFGIPLFDHWDLNLYFFAQAGKRYTPAVFSGFYRTDGRPIYYSELDIEEENRYSEIGQNWTWVDLSFKKYFEFWNMRYTWFIEVKNLFNRKNSQILNPVTGSAYEYGDQLPINYNDPVYPDRHWPHGAYPYNPARYLAPRQIYFGFSAEF